MATERYAVERAIDDITAALYSPNNVDLDEAIVNLMRTRISLCKHWDQNERVAVAEQLLSSVAVMLQEESNKEKKGM